MKGFKVILWRPKDDQVPDKYRTSTGQVPDKYGVRIAQIHRLIWVLDGEMRSAEIQQALEVKT